MKWFLRLAMFAALAGCNTKHDGHTPTGASHQHGPPAGDPHAGHSKAEGSVVLMVSTTPDKPQAGDSTTLKLMLHDAGGAVLKDFEVIHDKKVHLIVVRDGLDQFAHLHPVLDAAGNMTVTHSFPVGGLYRLYADHKPAGKPAATARSEIRVGGEVPPAPALAVNVPGRVEGDGLRAEVSVSRAKAGDEARIGFALTDASGKLVTDLQPYMGALGHLVVISADGKEYVHAHPAEGKAAGESVAFEAHFAGAGLYKGWGQFQRAGKVHAVSFVMKVD